MRRAAILAVAGVLWLMFTLFKVVLVESEKARTAVDADVAWREMRVPVEASLRALSITSKRLEMQGEIERGGSSRPVR